MLKNYYKKLAQSQDPKKCEMARFWRGLQNRKLEKTKQGKSVKRSSSSSSGVQSSSE
jgi:hypothetical protein